MIFETQRLTAERLSADHLADLTELHLDPEVCRHLGGVRSPAQTEAYLTANLAHWDRHGFGLWVVRTLDGRFAGRVAIRHVEIEGAPNVEIAYTFRRDLWGQGLATEAGRAMMRLWRDRRLSSSLIGIASPANTGSRRVLEKLGFLHERAAVYHGEAVILYRIWALAEA
jgi:RimJ/RimL family protein N-acetyltransferase